MNRGLLAVIIVLLGTTGCRVPAAGASAGVSVEPLPSDRSAQPTPSETPGPPPISAEAPAECGFPPGTALEYAGRSTTAALDVQEVVGDPMSDDAADIYISRDKMEQGDLTGRLVCAIYVDTPGFVEVTVHPDDGGRFVPPTPYPSTTPPAGGLAEADAIEAARTQVERPDEWEAALVEAGPIGKVLPYVHEDDTYAWARDLPSDRWVWRVFLVRGGEGVEVILDYLDGSLLGRAKFFVN